MVVKLLLWPSVWLVVSLIGCYYGSFGWLLGCCCGIADACYVVAMFLWLLAQVFVCSCSGVWDATMMALGGF